ncbi:MAG: nuclear transport factor 2 family protein [Rhizomicrobium sp.]
MTDALSPLDRLAITQTCIDLLYRFAKLNDDREADALAELFVADGVFRRPTLPDQPYEGREAIRAGFRAKPANLLTRHVICNPVITVLSANAARADSYILLYTAAIEPGAKLPVPANPKQLLGAFEDVIVRDTDGVWKFKTRNGSLAMTIGG